ncbi:MAG: cytochrome c [Anaerolineaceae bacterium]|nr:MAG: cytochrome c [Anaerolineaceae bacterium]
MRIIAALLSLIMLAACSELLPPPTPTRSLLERQGRSVFESYCSRCHGTSGDTVVVGPSLAGIASSGGGRRAGMDAEAYIRDSIMNPWDYTVEGFAEGVMPTSLKDELSPEELDAVVTYLLTLK